MNTKFLICLIITFSFPLLAEETQGAGSGQSIMFQKKQNPFSKTGDAGQMGSGMYQLESLVRPIGLTLERSRFQVNPSLDVFRSGKDTSSSEEVDCVRSLTNQKGLALRNMGADVKEAMKKYLCNLEFDKDKRFSEFSCNVAKQCARLTIESFGDNGVYGDTFLNYLKPYMQGKTLDKYLKYELGRSMPEVENAKEIRAYAKKNGIEIPDEKSCEDAAGIAGSRDTQCEDKGFIDDIFLLKQTTDCSLAFKGCYPINKEEFEKLDTKDGEVTKTELFINKIVEKHMEKKFNEEAKTEDEIFAILNSKDKKLDKTKEIKKLLDSKNNTNILDPALGLLLEKGFEERINRIVDIVKKTKSIDKDNFKNFMKSFKSDLIKKSFSGNNCNKKTSVTNICLKFDQFRDSNNPKRYISEDDLKKIYRDEEITEEEFQGLNENISNKILSKTHLANILNGSRCHAFQPQNKPDVVGYVLNEDGEKEEVLSTQKPPEGMVYTGTGSIYSLTNYKPIVENDPSDPLNTVTDSMRSRPDSSALIRVNRSVGDPSSSDFMGPLPLSPTENRGVNAIPGTVYNSSTDPLTKPAGPDTVISANTPPANPSADGATVPNSPATPIAGYDQFGHFTGAQGGDANGGFGVPNPGRENAPVVPQDNYIEDLNKKIAELSAKIDDQSKKPSKEEEEASKKSADGRNLAPVADNSEVKQLQKELTELKKELAIAKSTPAVPTKPLETPRSTLSDSGSSIVSRSKVAEDATERVAPRTQSISSYDDAGSRESRTISHSSGSSSAIGSGPKATTQATSNYVVAGSKGSSAAVGLLTRMDGMNPKTQAEAINRMIQSSKSGEEILIEEGGFIKAIVPIIENGKIVLDAEGNPKYEKLIKGKSSDKSLLDKLAKKDSRKPASVEVKPVASAADLKQVEDKAKLEEMARYRKLRCLTDSRFCDK